ARRVEVHEEGDGRVGPEQRAGVDRHERLPVQLEGKYVAVARRGRHAAERRAMPDPRAREGGGVEVHGLLRVLVEPQMWGDGLHGTTSSMLTRAVIGAGRQLLQRMQVLLERPPVIHEIVDWRQGRSTLLVAGGATSR